MIPIIKKTKCVTTLGPASNTLAIIKQLAENGATCMRLNFSHGNHDEHLARVKLIQTAEQELNIPLAIMLDTRGPEVRTHTFVNGSVEIKANAFVTIIVNKEIVGNDHQFSVNYPKLAQDVKINDNLLVDDGKLTLQVTNIENDIITCRALNTHTIKDRRAINIPNVKLSLPFISEKDKADLIFGCQQKVDFVAASFVCDAADILAIRKVLDSNGGKHIQIIAKIESQLAVNNFDAILKVADAIMVARGDLGVEIPFQKVPFLEKTWIAKARSANKAIIVATQMLDSMVSNPHPTRAEVTDVWTAVDWGTSATMLSGESANGNYPVLAVATMSKIIVDAENHSVQPVINNSIKDKALSSLISKIINEKPQYVITNSKDGQFLTALANSNLPIVIFNFVDNPISYHQFALTAGIYPLFLNRDNKIVLDDHDALLKLINNTYLMAKKAKIVVIDNDSTKPFTTFISK